MANDLNINVAGTWKSIDNCEINVGGVWKTPDKISINVGGVWKEVWAGTTVTLSGETVSRNTLSFPWRANATLKIDNDGNVYEYEGGAVPDAETYVQIDTATDWIRPTTANDNLYQIQVQKTSGSNPETFTINGVAKTVGTTWYTLDGDVILRNTVQGQFEQWQSTLSISIRYGTGSTLTTATYSLNASADL